MFQPAPSSDSHPNPKQEIGRRALLGAAWAAPVILAAVATPAAAASGGTSALTVAFGNFTVTDSGHGPSVSEVNFGVQYVYFDWQNVLTINPVTVDVWFPKSGYTGAYTTDGAAGWSGSVPMDAGSSWHVVFTFSQSVSQGQSTTQLFVYADRVSPWPGSITVTATAVGIASDAGTTPAATGSATL